jgi:hypothetical protein
VSVTLERPATRPVAARPEPRANRPRRWLLALFCLFGVAVVYHWAQSLGHVTPAVFTDELMFSELARSLAAGEWLTVRGEGFFFPSFLPALVQGPVWLLEGASAYGVAKALNAVRMCSAVFPAWALARLVVQPAYAFGVAAATVSGGAMLYHSYLSSEALALPVFLLAVFVSVRAVAEPSLRWDALAVLVLGAAVLTRAQFVVLPVAFVLTVLVVGRPLRRHALALSVLAFAALAGLIGGATLLGFYGGARELDYPALETLRFAGWTAALLPFAAGMLIVPGAVLGLGYAIVRPRRRAEAALGFMSAVLLVALPIQAGLIAAGEAHRPMERYVFYAVPLLFTAFFFYVERGAPRRRLYAATALALGGLVLVVPFSTLALEPFSFDSPTLSAVAALGRELSTGDAAALFGGVGLLAALAAAAVPLRRYGGAVAAAAIALSLAVGVAAYSGDRRMTGRAAESLAPAQKDWLDRMGIDADVLVLPGGSLHAGWMLESWNRNVGRTYHLGAVDDDPLPHRKLAVGPDGTVSAAGEPVESRHLVVNEQASRVELAGKRLNAPVAGLTLYRAATPLRLRSLAEGLYADGWARAVMTYSVWPDARGGEYRVRLALPRGRQARTVEAEAGSARRTGQLVPGTPLELRIPASGSTIPSLRIRVERADLVDGTTPRPRLVAARVTALEFIPKAGSRNQ